MEIRNTLALFNIIQASEGDEAFMSNLYRASIIVNNNSLKTNLFASIKTRIGYNLEPAYEYFVATNPIPILKVKKENRDSITIVEYFWVTTNKDFYFPFNIEVKNNNIVINGEAKSKTFTIETRDSLKFYSVENWVSSLMNNETIKMKLLYKIAD